MFAGFKPQFYYMVELNILSNSANDVKGGEIENVWNIWKEKFLELLNFRKYNSIQNLEVTEGYVQMLKYLVIPHSTKADQKKTKNHRNQQAGKYNLDKNAENGMSGKLISSSKGGRRWEEINLKTARLEVDSKIEDLQTRVSTSFSSNKKKSLSLSPEMERSNWNMIWLNL